MSDFNHVPTNLRASTSNTAVRTPYVIGERNDIDPGLIAGKAGLYPNIHRSSTRDCEGKRWPEKVTTGKEGVAREAHRGTPGTERRYAAYAYRMMSVWRWAGVRKAKGV